MACGIALKARTQGRQTVRIAVQLIEAETATHLWADRFDGPLDEVFALQDQVAIKVAGVIEPALKTVETAVRPNVRQAILPRMMPLRANAMLTASGAQIASPRAARRSDRARPELWTGAGFGVDLLLPALR